MHLKFKTLLLILTFLPLFLSAQTDKELLEKANSAFAGNQYEQAANLYKEALKSEYGNAYAQYFCGLSLFKSGYKAQSLPYFKNAYWLNPSCDKFLLKYLGRAYQLNYKFDSAIAVFNSYKSVLHEHDRHNRILEKDLIDKRIQECETAKQLIKSPKKVVITNLGNAVNTRYDEYSPAISADERTLMFTSSRDRIDSVQTTEEDEEKEEVFVSDWQDSSWASPKSLYRAVTGPNHDACVAISSNGSKLIVYKSSRLTKGDLYYSDLKDSVWTDPVRFGGDINSAYFEPSATINADNNILIFSSDRPGGEGGLDLYISRLLPNGKWGKAQNLGPVVNTKYDEDAPFLQTDQQTLHFSSNGHNSMGGYDIFTTKYNPATSSWSQPENVGYPVNTPDDDIYFIWNNEGTKAYFSSIRPEGMGGQDLYLLSLPSTIPPKIVIRGTVLNKLTQEPVASVLQVAGQSKDSNNVLTNASTTVSNGQYELVLPANTTYGLQVEAPGYLLYSENFSTAKTVEDVSVTKDILLQPIEEGKKVVLQNIFFDYKQSTVKKESETELKAVADFITQNGRMQIEISGHTDSIGSYAFNQKLSEARALSVKKYLEKLGVQQDQLTFKGYSFTKPVASNQTPEGRQRNRRTEFLILKK